jgi:type II secretory pathway component GspD/PulD (secretin)
MKKHRHLSGSLYNVMRMSLFQLLIILITAVSSKGGPVHAKDILNQKISIQVNNQEMKTVLNKLNKLTQIHFTYSSALIRSQKKVTLHAVDKPLSDVLDELFRPANITYKIEGKQIVLLKSMPQPESSIQEIIRNPNGMERSISGKSL